LVKPALLAELADAVPDQVLGPFPADIAFVRIKHVALLHYRLTFAHARRANSVSAPVLTCLRAQLAALILGALHHISRNQELIAASCAPSCIPDGTAGTRDCVHQATYPTSGIPLRAFQPGSEYRSWFFGKS